MALTGLKTQYLQQNINLKITNKENKNNSISICGSASGVTNLPSQIFISFCFIYLIVVIAFVIIAFI